MRSLPKPNIVNMHTARASLPNLLDRVARGEEIIITRAGKPVAKLIPMQRPRQPRVPGSAKHLITWMADDFNITPEEILRDFGV